MLGPMRCKDTTWGPFVYTHPTLQPIKLAFEVHYEPCKTCLLIVQGGQAFPLGPDPVRKAIRICGWEYGSQGGLRWCHRRGCHEA